MKQDTFKNYYKHKEPDKREKGYAWSTAIGLQQVDGITVSDYLTDTAIKHIEGKITINEAQELLNSYYETKNDKRDADRVEEADKVSARIAMILSEQSFSLSRAEYISIHRKLFEGIYSHAGKVRDYNITKAEWVLNGRSVIYGSTLNLIKMLDYDIDSEKEFSYKGLDMNCVIVHLANFLANLWQIHAFGEGNTRTTAVFFIKYLRYLGFNTTNDIFVENAWFFRNALVRANYNDIKNGIYETKEFLILFLRNLLLEEKNPLSNRTMHISVANESYKTIDSLDGYVREPLEYNSLESDESLANKQKLARLACYAAKMSDIITEARNDAGLTQKELAEKTGIRQSNISRIESGKCSPTLDTLQTLAEGMGKKLIIEFI